MTNTHYITVHEISSNCGNTELVVQQELTATQAEDLLEYFEECSTYIVMGEPIQILLTNDKEQLEGSPMPDGTIVLAKEFSTGKHSILIGKIPDRGRKPSKSVPETLVSGIRI